MNAGTRSPKVTLIDLMGPSRPTPGRMGLMALARAVHRQATAGWSKPEGFTTPKRDTVTMENGVRMVPVAAATPADV